MSTIKVYLAPANHYNAYCISGYDEKTQCEKLAGLVRAGAGGIRGRVRVCNDRLR